VPELQGETEEIAKQKCKLAAEIVNRRFDNTDRKLMFSLA
jgi:hypothetical protein